VLVEDEEMDQEDVVQVGKMLGQLLFAVLSAGAAALYSAQVLQPLLLA
jgi:hypothetical protein